MLPAAFLQFLADNDIDPRVYSPEFSQTLPRFIRINPRKPIELSALQAQFKDAVIPSFIPGFYQLTPSSNLSRTEAYQQGQVYGMDVASGVGVLCLNVEPSDHVLDLCAAPGAKLCMISDLLHKEGSCTGSVTGVDISKDRVSVAQSLLSKYRIARTRLFRADGTTFNEPPPAEGTWISSRVQDLIQPSTRTRRKKKRNRAKRDESLDNEIEDEDIEEKEGQNDEKEAKREDDEGVELKDSSSKPSLVQTQWQTLALPSCLTLPPPSPSIRLPSFDGPCTFCADCQTPGLYDKVLVDAECSHDGSIKHVQKYEQWGWDSLEQRMMDPDRILNIVTLQRRLLCNGFKNLKAGGSLVYSTCSLSRNQNESVVEWFVQSHPNALLIAPEFNVMADSELAISTTPTTSASAETSSPATSTTATSTTTSITTPTTTTSTTATSTTTSCPPLTIPFSSSSLSSRAAGLIPLTYRFDPIRTRTSGLFIAKFTKRSN